MRAEDGSAEVGEGGGDLLHARAEEGVLARRLARHGHKRLLARAREADGEELVAHTLELGGC